MKTGSELFMPVERVAFAALALLLVLLVSSVSLQRSADNNYADAALAADRITRQIFEQIGVVTGITTSLSVLQQVASDVGGDELDVYAQGAFEASGIIASIGRYDRVVLEELDYFSAQMAERGVYRFEIKDLDAEGTRTLIGAREIYHPVVRVYPFSPRLSTLVGVDLSTSSTLGKALKAATAANLSALSSYPAGWPRSGDLVLVHPTYLGRYVPESSEERELQSNGGFFAELDLNQLLHSVAGAEPTLTLELQFIDPIQSSVQTLASVEAVAGGQKYLRTIFSGFRGHISPQIGLGALTLTMVAADGLSLAALEQAALHALLAVAAMMLIIVLVRARRLSDIRNAAIERSLAREKEIALITLEAIGDAVVTADSDGVISYVNPATETLLNMKSAQLVGEKVQTRIHFQAESLDDQAGQADSFSLDAAMQQPAQLKLPDLKVLDSTRQPVHVDSVLTPFGGTESVENGTVLVMRDVSTERELSRELEYRATHDTLTRLSNRYLFELRLGEMVTASIEQHEQHAICYIDLDQFKIVNDTCGHSAGDKLLVQVAAALKSNVRQDDIIARLGGDEFGLLIRHCDEDSAESIARRVHDLFQDFYYQDEEQLFAIRASIGFVFIAGQYSGVEEVLAAADLACYSAKDRGRNELHIYRPGCEQTSSRKGEMLLLPKLQNALRCDNFCLFVQPIAKIEADTLIEDQHYEILLRMVEDDGRLVTPFQLILAAERYDLMRDIDRWVIDRAFRSIAQLAAARDGVVPTFSINLSGQSTVDAELIGFIGGKLAQTGIDPRKLCFEVTETSAIANMQHAVGLLDFLHELGCTLALDDFGSGVSSFGYLKKLPVDYLKIDGQFVRDIENCDVNREMVRCIQRVAKLLEIETVAEFVENAGIVDQLRLLDIDYAQGYHISKPFAFEDLHTLSAQSSQAA